jgi:hypothetical protein
MRRVMPATITVPDEKVLSQRLAEADPGGEATVLYPGVLAMAGATFTGVGLLTRLTTVIAEQTGTSNDADTRAKQAELFRFVPRLIEALTDDEGIHADAAAFLERALGK